MTMSSPENMLPPSKLTMLPPKSKVQDGSKVWKHLFPSLFKDIRNQLIKLHEKNAGSKTLKQKAKKGSPADCLHI